MTARDKCNSPPRTRDTAGQVQHNGGLVTRDVALFQAPTVCPQHRYPARLLSRSDSSHSDSHMCDSTRVTTRAQSHATLAIAGPKVTCRAVGATRPCPVIFLLRARLKPFLRFSVNNATLNMVILSLDPLECERAVEELLQKATGD